MGGLRGWRACGRMARAGMRGGGGGGTARRTERCLTSVACVSDVSSPAVHLSHSWIVMVGFLPDSHPSFCRCARARGSGRYVWLWREPCMFYQDAGRISKFMVGEIYVYVGL